MGAEGLGVKRAGKNVAPHNMLEAQECRYHWTFILAHVLHMCQRHDMSIMIQVRNVPEPLHRELVRRAEARGQTLTAYIQGILEREVARPSRTEVVSRLLALEPVSLDRPVAEYVREDRDQRSG